MSHDDRKWEQRLERERCARRRAETIAEEGLRELYLANQQLEERVRLRTEDLERSVRMLERLCVSRRGLLDELAHELATPLHILRGNLDLVGGRNTDDVAYLRTARDAASRLDSLLQAMLAVGKSEDPLRVPTLERRAPREVVDDLLQHWIREAARRAQLLSAQVTGCDDDILFDWGSLRLIADALLDSCVQFCGAGPVHVRLDVGDDRVLLSVEDPGPALPVEVVGGAATPLMWASAGRRGIGMAVAQHLADEIGASFTVSVTDGRSRAQLVTARP